MQLDLQLTQAQLLRHLPVDTEHKTFVPRPEQTKSSWRTSSIHPPSYMKGKAQAETRCWLLQVQFTLTHTQTHTVSCASLQTSFQVRIVSSNESEREPIDTLEIFEVICKILMPSIAACASFCFEPAADTHRVCDIAVCHNLWMDTPLAAVAHTRHHRSRTSLQS